VKGLSRHFEEKITQIFGVYVQSMLAQYNANPKANWKSKDAALYLVTSLATRAKTAKHGITQTNQLVNLGEFCSSHILPELQNYGNTSEFPILKADCVKYVLIFRSQLPPEMVKSSLPALVQLLKFPAVVLHTYAAAAIDKILIMKDSSGAALLSAQQLAPLTEDLLKNLFGAFEFPGSTENEYVMKAVMRSFSALQNSVVPYLAHLLPPLTNKLAQAAKNPTRPHYNHYLFESLSLSIRIVCQSNPQAVSSFEQVLFPVFEEILKMDVQEFVPYVFQIMSLMLELHSEGNVPEPYMALFSFLLVPLLWERPANIHPLVRLLQAFISRGPAQVVGQDRITGLLGVFQKLIASKTYDHEGFYLLQSMVEHLPPETLSNYIKQVFIVLFQRLTSSKTTKYVKSLLVFFFVYVIKNGGSQLISTVDSIQNGIFGMVCDSLIVKDGTVQKISGATEKKIAAVGLTKLLCETEELGTGGYADKFPGLLLALISLFELPEDESIPDDEHFIEIEDTPGYQTAYSQLIFAGRPDYDPVAGVSFIMYLWLIGFYFHAAGVLVVNGNYTCVIRWMTFENTWPPVWARCRPGGRAT
jgi:exportin-2 (importin alpha re-exporter)